MYTSTTFFGRLQYDYDGKCREFGVSESSGTKEINIEKIYFLICLLVIQCEG